MVATGWPRGDAVVATWWPRWWPRGNWSRLAAFAGDAVTRLICSCFGLIYMWELEHSLRQHGIEIAGWVLPPPGDPWDIGADKCEGADGIPTVDPATLPIEDRAAGLAFLPYDLEVPIERIAESMEHPVEAYQLTLLCAVASLIPSQTRLVVDSFSGTDAPPILWGGLVGEPGCGTYHIIHDLTRPITVLRALEGFFSQQPDAVERFLSQQPDRSFLVVQDDLASFLWDIGPSQSDKGAKCIQWLKLHSGNGAMVRSGAGKRVFVQHPSVSIIGRIWPPTFRGFFQRDDLLTDLLWKSFVWVRVHLMSNFNTCADPPPIPSYLYGLLKETYSRIRSSQPIQHVLSRVGQQYWREWCMEVREVVSRETDRRIRFSLSGMPEQAARVTLVLHRLDEAFIDRQPSLVVPADTLLRAIGFVYRLQKHAAHIRNELWGTRRL